MRGKDTTLKLLNVSRMAAHETALHLKDKDAARRADSLSPTLSKQGEYLVWVYRQFLTSTVIPFQPDHEIDAALERTGAAWEEVFAALSAALPDETYRDLVKAWRSANDALGAILRRESEPPRPEALFTELERCLEQAAKDFSGGDRLDSVVKKLDTMHRDIKSGNREIHDVHKKIDPNYRYHGVEKAENLARQTQIRAAIDCSWDEQFEIARPSSKQENRGKKTIADLARTVWERNEAKWKYANDGYQTCKAYEVALRAQFDRNTASFRLLDDESADQSNSL